MGAEPEEKECLESTPGDSLVFCPWLHPGSVHFPLDTIHVPHGLSYLFIYTQAYHVAHTAHGSTAWPVLPTVTACARTA